MSSHRLYTSTTVARALGLHPAHVRRIRRNLGVGTQIGQIWFYTVADVATIERRRKWTARQREVLGAKPMH